MCARVSVCMRVCDGEGMRAAHEYSLAEGSVQWKSLLPFVTSSFLPVTGKETHQCEKGPHWKRCPQIIAVSLARASPTSFLRPLKDPSGGEERMTP